MEDLTLTRKQPFQGLIGSRISCNPLPKGQNGHSAPLSGYLEFFERPSCTCQHVEIGAEEQRVKPICVLLQFAICRFGVSKLTLHDPEDVFHLMRLDDGIDLLIGQAHAFEHLPGYCQLDLSFSLWAVLRPDRLCKRLFLACFAKMQTSWRVIPSARLR